MISVAWSFLAGVPIGVLAAWSAVDAVGGTPGALVLAGGGLAGGLVLAAAVGGLARARGDEPARRRHLAAAAGAAWSALPALAARALGLEPGAAVWCGASLLLVALLLLRGARLRGPAPGPFALAAGALAAALVGGLVVAVVAGWLAASRAAGPGAEEEAARAIYDLDAQVPTRPLLRCDAAPRSVDVLLDRGARPSATRDGGSVWFDARAEGGSRQIHRLDRGTREVTCWSCGEPGDNLRPHPSERGQHVVFETTRWATWRDPGNTELQLAIVREGRAPDASRRVTFAAGPDERARFAPGGGRLVWSRWEEGAYVVAVASLRIAHGGLVLARPGVLASGGARWIASPAWSPDARALVLARGNPFAPAEASAFDLATGRSAPLGDDVTHVAFSADGSFALIAASRRDRALGLLPASAGFLLGALAERLGEAASLYRDTRIRAGEPWGEGAPLALGPVADWGEPTGLSLLPETGDGELRFVLGQRRPGPAGGVEERLLEIALACGAAR